MKTFWTLILLIGLIALAIVPGIWGLILAFKASIILGIMVLIIQPSPTILGWVAIFGHPEVAKRISEWLHLAF